MRTLGSLIVIFILFGIISPFFTQVGYSQQTTDGDYLCQSSNMDMPGVSFVGSGYVFMTYLVNVHIDRSGTRIPSCSDQIQTTMDIAYNFMQWPQ